jgi:hypothetical protein
MDEMEEPSVAQTNDGGGHNVNAINSDVSVTTFNGLSTADLISSVRRFNRLISWRSFISARNSIETLETISNVSNEGPQLLNVLKYKLKLYQGESPILGREIFLHLLKSSTLHSDLKDYVGSVFIDFLSVNSTDHATQYYHGYEHRGIFCDEIYFEKLAAVAELQASLAKPMEVEEEIFCALVRGFRRHGEFTKAAEAARLLYENYPNENSRLLNIHADSLQISLEVGSTHYWMLSAQSKERLNTLIDDFLEYFQSTSDIRNFEIAAYLLPLTSYQHMRLINICESNQIEVQKYIPDFKVDGANLAPIESILDANSSIDENSFVRVYAAIRHGRIAVTEFVDWLDGGGEVRCENPELEVLIDLLKQSISWVSNEDSQSHLIKEVSQEQIARLKDIVGKVNPHILCQLCEAFNYANMPHHTVTLLESIISDTPWLSPLIEVYAFALKANDRHQSLKDLLSSFKDISASLNLIILSTQLVLSLNDYEEAKRLTKIATDTHPKLIHSWYYRFLVIVNSNKAMGISDHSEILEVAKEMPLELFETHSELAKTVLHYLNLVDRDFVSSVALKWFICNPSERAKDVTELYLSELQDGGNFGALPYQPVKNCQFGITFIKNDEKPTTKLLVKNAPQNVSLMDTNTPLGRFLEKSKAGDETKIGIYNYKVVETLPASIAVFRIASKLREEHNAGEDCFYSINTDPDDIVGSMTAFLEQFTKKSLIPPVINGRNLPLLVRINFSKNDLVNDTLDYLQDRDSNLHTALSDKGTTNYNDLIIDSLTMIYLALGGYSKGLISLPVNLFITIETKSILSHWVEQKFHPDYMSVDVINGQLIKFDANSSGLDSFLLNLRELLKNCQVMKPALYDMPNDLTRFKTLLDPSHYSSLKLSASRSIPLLCLDHLMVSFYDANSLIPLANLNELIKRSIQHMSNNNLYLFQHIYSDFVAPVGHKDIERLCCGSTQEQWLAFKLINKYASNIDIDHLFTFSRLAISRAVEGSKSWLQLSESKYTEHIVNACCSAAISKLMKDSTVNGLTVLSASLLTSLHISHRQRYQLGIELLGGFCRGHFIDLNQQGLAIDKYIEDNRYRW